MQSYNIYYLFQCLPEIDFFWNSCCFVAQPFFRFGNLPGIFLFYFTIVLVTLILCLKLQSRNEAIREIGKTKTELLFQSIQNLFHFKTSDN